MIIDAYHYFDVYGHFHDTDLLMINKDDIYDWDNELGDYGCLEVYYEED